MAPVSSDRDDEEQAELGFGPGGRAPAGDDSFEEEVEAASADRGERGGEPARAEFFRERRRPVLPFVGLIGAVATVAAFLWLGRDEAPVPTPVAAETDALAPVAAPSPSAPAALPAGLETAPAASPSSLAAAPPAAAEGEPDAAFGDPVPAPPATAPAPVAAAAPAAPLAAAAPPRSPDATTKGTGAAAKSAFSVQLLAARSEADVNGAWKRLQGAHPDLLRSLSPTVARADVAGGTFYRLRAGPLGDRPDAEALCHALASRQQPCFVVSPGS